MTDSTFDPRLTDRVRDYVRAGYWVTSQTQTSVIVEKGSQRVRVYLEGDQVIVDGPPPIVAFDGRLKAWAILGAALVIVYAVAIAVGWLR